MYYSLIPNLEALRLLKSEASQIVLKMPENFATVYQTKKNKFLIVPDFGEFTMLFDNEEKYKMFLADPKFPMINNHIFLEEKDHLCKVPDQIEHFYSQFNRIFDVQISNVNTDQKMKDFFDILKNRNDILKKEEAYIPVTIIIGDFLCSTLNFHWEIRQNNFQFYGYCTPIVVHKSGIEFHQFWDIARNTSATQLTYEKFEDILTHFIETIKLNYPGIDF
ncbi:MAG: hypothetical protein KIT80_00120 [Chitinophagaceae bacterium]|nr:hypothetical protein [Chitinophagaceae bacterium]MCW5925295.1 hypothetical protein [Chitinophagaceae bacterium]